MKGLTQFARATAVNRISTVNRERLHLIEGASEDAVHDFRVSLRRLEPVFTLFSIEPLGLDDLQAVIDLCETWMRAAGKVRDCDVVRKLLPDEFKKDVDRLRHTRALQLMDLVNAGSLPTPKRRPGAWANEPEVVMFAAMTLPHLANSYFQAGARAVAKKRSLHRLHEFRLHGKELRYSLELFQSLYGGRLGALQRLLKQMQKVLGEMADARAAIKLCRKLGVPDQSTVFDSLGELADDKIAEFARMWRAEVPDAEAAARWIKYLRRFARPHE